MQNSISQVREARVVSEQAQRDFDAKIERFKDRLSERMEDTKARLYVHREGPVEWRVRLRRADHGQGMKGNYSLCLGRFKCVEDAMACATRWADKLIASFNSTIE